MARKTVYNKINTEEKWNQINVENKELLEEFLEYCEAGGKSKTTIVNYTSDIKIFFCWNLDYNKNKPFYEITKRALIKYQNHMTREWGLGDSRMRRLKSSLSSMSEFCEAILEEEVEEWKGFRNIINKIPKIVKGEPRRKKTVLNFDDIEEKILKPLVEKGKYQYACCVALATYGGARKSELPRFKVEWFSEDYIYEGCLYKTPEKIEVKGRGDHRKYKYTLKNQFDYYLNLWLEERDRLGIESEWLFVAKNKNGYKQACDITLDGWKRYIDKFLEESFYWHALRHTFVTYLKGMNIPTHVIVEIVGWSEKTGDVMVNIYNDKDALDDMSKYFSKDGVIKQNEDNTISDL